jgi:uncharacterized membrane protein (DUF4010 family)
MTSWLQQVHGGSAAFPPAITAIKLAVALGIGLLIGFERQWSQKDFGVRTFSLTALLGAVTALMSAPIMLMGMAATISLAVLLNVRDIVKSQTIEGTTSVALLVTFVLGVLAGNGHVFTSVACAIVATWLLSLKPQFQQFAGGVRAEEIRSAVMLGLFGFVVWPLLPNRYVDPWSLLEPREAWVTVVVVACIGFINYVLLRIYGRRGIALTAILGGLVNSTAAAAELSTSLPAAGLVEQTIPAVLLTSVAMFARNAILLAVFARSAVPFAVLPLLAMMLVALYFVYRHHHAKRRDEDEEEEAQDLELDLASPVSPKKVLNFGLLFLIIQVLGTLGARWLGNGGILLISVIGGTVSSASTTAAAANLVTHGSATALQGATATVLTSITSTAMNLPLIRRHIKVKAVVREIMLATALQATAGVLVLLGQAWLFR